ncbi:MAG: hypothetical protein GXO34_08850 [Deltaproteobacteria bacterium]|nr:hypothetical protein [Deltaproteobacteria bacterium]
MQFMSWFLNNFGLFFGIVFLYYIYLMIHRLTIIYDYLRTVPLENRDYRQRVGEHAALKFLEPFFDRLRRTEGAAREAVVDAVWSEVEGRIGIHFQALNGYVNTLILIGFAGTIFGSIGAFNEMFAGLAKGRTATTVFAAAWNSGLATALYTSLAAGVIGGLVVTIIYSRFLMARMKRLETLVGLRISEIVDATGESAVATQPRPGQVLDRFQIQEIFRRASLAQVGVGNE